MLGQPISRTPQSPRGVRSKISNSWDGLGLAQCWHPRTATSSANLNIDTLLYIHWIDLNFVLNEEATRAPVQAFESLGRGVFVGVNDRASRSNPAATGYLVVAYAEVLVSIIDLLVSKSTHVPLETFGSRR